MLSTLIDPWLLYPIIIVLKGVRYAATWSRGTTPLLLIKLKDSISGGVFPDGKISKPMVGNDRVRQRGAEEVCRKILK